jgi:hypothetical protein
MQGNKGSLSLQLCQLFKNKNCQYHLKNQWQASGKDCLCINSSAAFWIKSEGCVSNELREERPDTCAARQCGEVDWRDFVRFSNLRDGGFN